MTDSPDKIQWHPAFCAAAGLESVSYTHLDVYKRQLSDSL